jgi:hypothetical protein
MVSFEHGEDISEAICSETRMGRLKLNEHGSLYSWGCGQDGRLGLGDVDESDIYEFALDPTTDLTYSYVLVRTIFVLVPTSRWSLFYIQEPTLVGPLLGVEIKLATCGFEHSVAVTRAGLLYTWGETDSKFHTRLTDSLLLPRQRRRWAAGTRRSRRQGYPYSCRVNATFARGSRCCFRGAHTGRCLNHKLFPGLCVTSLGK